MDARRGGTSRRDVGGAGDVVGGGGGVRWWVGGLSVGVGMGPGLSVVGVEFMFPASRPLDLRMDGQSGLAPRLRRSRPLAD